MGLASAIGGALALGGSLLSSSSQKKAATKAANVSEANNERNVALQREIYGSNQAALSPFMQRGNAAGEQLNAMLLGAPQPSTQSMPAPQPNALSQFYGGGINPANMWGVGDGFAGYNPALAQDINPQVGANYAKRFTMAPRYTQSALGQQVYQPAAQPMAQNNATLSTAQSADPFEVFRNSTGYQFRMNEALDAVNSNTFGGGFGQSGAALKALQDRAGQVADNTFGQYAGLLQGQQAVGAGSASALAGVGQSFANSVTNSNTMNAANQANAALARGDSGFGNALGMIGGTILGGAFG